MITVELKFENDYDKESFLTSVITSFNKSGKYKSVHANTVERVGDTLFFTKQELAETAEIADVTVPAYTEEIDLSELSPVSSTTETTNLTEGGTESSTQPETEIGEQFIEDVQSALDEGLLEEFEVGDEELSQPLAPEATLDGDLDQPATIHPEAEFTSSPEPSTEVN